MSYMGSMMYILDKYNLDLVVKQNRKDKIQSVQANAKIMPKNQLAKM